MCAGAEARKLGVRNRKQKKLRIGMQRSIACTPTVAVCVNALKEASATKTN